MSNLLYNKRPLIVNPELACIIGLNEAIILQQVHYWIEKKKESNIDFHDGRYWAYNTYEGWQNQFPFWSISTIRRTISKLEKIGLLLSGNYNRLGIDKTKWYTINYELVKELKNYKQPSPSDQNEQMDCSHYTDTSHQNEHTNTRDYTETIPETVELNGVVLKHNTCVFDPNILERQIIKSCKKNGISQYNQEQYIEIIKYYYNIYMQTFRKEHPRLSEKAMDSVIYNLLHCTLLIDGSGFEEYKLLIDKHFDTRYDNCDYNICHFMTDGIRDNRFYETCY
ncbi:hypothetical protein AALH30_21370 [Blautia pseudococcoides]|uniref:hypothetical protein n=1 Tax=Blautia pseudococcoides TaxID=1796616 RepID=UPI00148B2957|nr:hypothetical protein [Blautia pseudococcoides]QJU14820.1 hypothetical protein HL650_10335 [Blautia pseudococcoides]